MHRNPMGAITDLFINVNKPLLLIRFPMKITFKKDSPIQRTALILSINTFFLIKEKKS